MHERGRDARPEHASFTPAAAASVAKYSTTRSGKFDVVLVHFDPANIQATLAYWSDFLGSKKVEALEPYMWVYCQNGAMEDHLQLLPLIEMSRSGGTIVQLANVGRESHAYLQHITQHYHELAQHTLFSQDLPDPGFHFPRFENMFHARIGFLPLSWVNKGDCFNDYHPGQPSISQLFAMLSKSFCRPEGFTAAFQGRFVVSRQRILGQTLETYLYLLDLISAPPEHWIHKYWDAEEFKHPANPALGHALERTWSVAFDCHEPWRFLNCEQCDAKDNQDCGPDSCACYDKF